MEPDEDKVWSSKRENSCSGEKALMCFLGLVSGVAARGKKERGLNGVTHVWLDLVRQ